jgi:hypothetical protein
MPSLRGSRPIVGLVTIGLLLGFALGAAISKPKLTASEPTASPASSLVAVASDHATPRPTSRPSIRPTAAPSASPTPACEPPQELPVPDGPAWSPRITHGDNALVFTSYLYKRDSASRLVAIDQTNELNADWQVGLWYAAPGSHDARLLLAPTGGMVLPLALSPDATRVAVWWLPERRGLAEPACLSGIYSLSIADSTSSLLLLGDWSYNDGDGGEPELGPKSTDWLDPWTDPSAPRRYSLPSVSFSADGGYIAIAGSHQIAIHDATRGGVGPTHDGDCSDWSWAPTGSLFVAGCESMTSAWVAGGADDFVSRSVALPAPELQPESRAWDRAAAAAIGITSDGRIRVARFYGFAIGCESPDCVLPVPAWAMSTTDWGTGLTTSTSTAVQFLIDGDAPKGPIRFSPNASWFYARTLDNGGRVIDVATGDIRRVPLLAIGSAQLIDGGRLFYRGSGENGGAVVVRSIGRAGSTRLDATLQLPVGATSREGDLLVAGLLVGLP